jgi:hypothetical protein
MPCAAPCDRIPCDERCSLKLPCGHQCPGLCGEICPVGFCQACGENFDRRVDLLEFKNYNEVDVDESPVIILNCGHLFTAESLDGMVGLTNVYNIDQLGNISGPKDFPGELAEKVPQCPDCHSPIRQYATQRYNRIINRAVIDEMSRRFIVHGQFELRKLDEEVSALETDLTATLSHITDPGISEKEGALWEIFSASVLSRYEKASKVELKVRKIQREFARRHQPENKLHDAIIRSNLKNIEIEDSMNKLMVPERAQTPDIDSHVTIAARLMEMKVSCIILEDKFSLSSRIAPGAQNALSTTVSGGVAAAAPVLKSCHALVDESLEVDLPKYAVEASLFYYRIAVRLSFSGSKTDEERKKAREYRGKAKGLLANAKSLCQNEFQGSKELGQAVTDAIGIMSRDTYEEVTQEEIEAIKAAMTSGPRGMATNAGHWYKCVKGHPVKTCFFSSWI